MTPWQHVENALDAMLERRWYTNHGPMAQALESHAAALFGVRHAIAVANPAIGLVMLLDALALTGKVLLPPGARSRCHQALHWAGLSPAHRMGPLVSAILCSPGDDAHRFAALAAEAGIPFLSDGPSQLGPAHLSPAHLSPALIDLPACGDDAGAACITTGDDALAARLRNIRSSYGAGPPVPVRRTANGRISEIQAAMALLALAPHAPR